MFEPALWDIARRRAAPRPRTPTLVETDEHEARLCDDRRYGSGEASRAAHARARARDLRDACLGERLREVVDDARSNASSACCECAVASTTGRARPRGLRAHELEPVALARAAGELDVDERDIDRGGVEHVARIVRGRDRADDSADPDASSSSTR